MSETPQSVASGSSPQVPSGGVALGTLLGLAMLVVVFYHGPDLVPARFAEHRIFGWFGLNALCLLVVPLALIRWAFRLRPAQFGLQWGDARVWGRYAIGFGVVVVPAIVLASRMPQFHIYYPRYALARADLLAWGVSFLGWGLYFLAWEFFFRGFLLQLVASRYGAYAIIVQTIPFTMMHFTKPEVECWSAIVAGLALGLMAYRSRSCVGPWLLHWGCATLMDLLVILWPLRT